MAPVTQPIRFDVPATFCPDDEVEPAAGWEVAAVWILCLAVSWAIAIGVVLGAWRAALVLIAWMS